MRIGVLGGTFDPPHAGHLALARAALEQLQLDEVLFMPVSRNPLKRERAQSPKKHRLEMVRLAIEDEPRFAVSDIEIRRGGLSYAVDSMEQLREARPADYWFLLGADALKTIDQWKNPKKLLRLCRLGVAVRPPDTVEGVLSRLSSEVRRRVDVITMQPIDVSSSDLRAMLAKSESTGMWIPKKVLQYAVSHRLYGS